MPLYEYHCAKCDKKFELLVGMDAKPSCPLCGSASVERLLSSFSAMSKGGGSCDSGSCMPGGDFPCGGSPSCGSGHPPCMGG